MPSPVSRPHRWLRLLAGGLLGFVVLLAAGMGGYAWRALPQTEGRLMLPGNRAEVRIERDSQGVPSIHAQTEDDLAWGLGVVHAQDRLWQMETQRRLAAGRMAEAFGPPALEGDRFLRALGVRRAAQRQWQQLPAATRALLQAYTDGVNAVLAQALRARPPEFVLLGLNPEPWTPVDSLGWSLMMAWDLGGNWSQELLRMRLAQQLPVHRIQQMLPPYPGDMPLPVADFAALYRALGLVGSPQGASPRQSALDPLLRLADAAPPSGIEGTGSNIWVLAGSRTTTGQPLLANDPHLRMSVPSLWYVARLYLPGLRVAGATLPGLPGVLLGANDHIAWGFTNTGPDVQDLYLEQLDPSDPKRYRTPEGWAAFETEKEMIRVKGAAAVEITVRRTRHGPVISDAGAGADALPAVASSASSASSAADASGASAPGMASPAAAPLRGEPAGYVLALRWTALEPDHDALSAAHAMQRARSVDAFFAAARGWTGPMQNMAVADRSGRIGMISPGRIPLRGPKHDLYGLAPAPGWEARYDWQGWLPAGELPQVLNPPLGFIANANQRVTAADYPHYLGTEWAWPWRQQRIEQLLGARPQHSLQDLQAMQADVQSMVAQALLPWLRKAQSAHPLAARAHALLAGWDGQMQAESPAPLLYWAWQRQLAQAVFADEVSPALWERSLQGRSFTDALSVVLAAGDNSWCDDRHSLAPETCMQQADRALTLALEELQTAYGDDPGRWRWGQAHQTRLEHQPFSRVAALSGLFELRVPVGGDSHTLNANRAVLRPDARSGQRYHSDHGPGLRMLHDLADPAQSRFMIATGQSGLVFSPLYRNLAEPWRRGEMLPLWGTPGERKKVLVLQPVR